MRLELDLKKKILKDDEDNFYFSFEEWSYTPPRKGELYGEFVLGDLFINHKEISNVKYEKEKETLSFTADYDGEGYFSDIELISETKYNQKHLIKDLDSDLDTYVYNNPLTGGEGTVKGEIEVYFDYENEEFIITINRLILEEY
jgi:hypothetical protein